MNNRQVCVSCQIDGSPYVADVVMITYTAISTALAIRFLGTPSPSPKKKARSSNTLPEPNKKDTVIVCACPTDSIDNFLDKLKQLYDLPEGSFKLIKTLSETEKNTIFIINTDSTNSSN